jgi:hypothetical protein
MGDLLVFLLALFGRLGTGPRRLSFGFLLARVALSISLILLSLALFDQVIMTGNGPADLFEFAFYALHGSVHRFLRSALLIPHGSTSRSVVFELALDATQGLPTARPVKRRRHTAPG